MKHVNQMAARILDTLTKGLDELGAARKIDNGGPGIMSVSVERIGTLGTMGPLFSVTHYYIQNGDMMRDPEMIFLKGGDGNYYPTYFRQDNLGMERESVMERDGQILLLKREQADQATFAGNWMRNIREQQKIEPAWRPRHRVGLSSGKAAN